MAEIPLRSYLREIEEHIESGRTDQAIAHSRYILQTYPKYVDAYRLLGKAFLESQRFTDANDIFQRVLSSVPDDYVSHVGMSIIREDEGNLDEAIWHMEHAFEVQPSNNAIQEELRRLYGRRDNFEPPKIRLTRGALARLYTRGELYQQAIAEIRASLGENSNRLDLQALLAEVYLKTDQRVEAADMALAVLRRLPNCVVANQVMVQVLSGTDREAELKTHRDRLNQLDPYAAFTPPGSLSTLAVPDQAVTIEKLDWRPDSSMTDTSQPAWAASLGVDMAVRAADQPEPLPDWLIETNPEEEEPASPGSPVPAFIIDEEEDEILLVDGERPSQEPAPDTPEMHVETAWEPEEVSQAGSDAELEGEAGIASLEGDSALEAADIPDWLIALAPAAQAVTNPSDEEDLTPWLNQALASKKIEEPAESGGEEALEHLPDWLLETESEAPGEPVAEAETTLGGAFELPDRLDQEAIEQAETFESPETLAGEPALSPGEIEIPDWLKALQADGGVSVPDQLEAELEAELDSMDWDQRMGEILPEGPTAEIAAGAVAAAAASDIPEWLLESSDGEAEFEAREGQAELSGFPDDLPDWLRRVDEPGEAPAPEAAGAGSELPDWLLEVQEAQAAAVDESPTFEEPEPTRLDEQAESIFEAEEPFLGDTQPTRVRTTAEPERPEAETPPETGFEVETIFEEGLELAAAAGLVEAAEGVFAEEPEAVEEPLEAIELEAALELPAELEEPLEVELEAELEEAAALEGELEEEPLPVEPVQEALEAPAPASQGDLDEAFAWLLGLQAVAAPGEETLEEVELEPLQVEAQVEPGEGVAQEDLSEAETIESILGVQTTGIETDEESRLAAGSILAALDAELSDQDAEFEWLESLAVSKEEELEPGPEAEAPLEAESTETDLEGLHPVVEEWVQEGGERLAAPAEAGLSEALQEAPESLPAGPERIETPAMQAEEIEPEGEAREPETRAEEEIPELPEWLSEAEMPAEELEWTPPPTPHRRYELNLASFSEIEALPGIGHETAQKIVEYREERGPFRTIEDLLKIPGFGLMTLEGVRDYLFVEKAEAEPVEVESSELPEPEQISNELGEARSAITQGNLSQAMDLYTRVIASNQELDLVTRDLEEAAYRFPEEADVWQNLGDAYLRLGQIQEALKSFMKAKELLR